MSKEAKAESHGRIVANAARLFREQGIWATSVGDVMSAAGLTHGGFYRHFASKAALVEAAICAAAELQATRLEDEIAADGPDAALSGFVERYLSKQHVESRGTGCPLAALSAEVGLESDGAPTAISAALIQLTDIISGCLQHKPDPRSTATGLIATLVGAVTLARATPEGETRDAILDAAREAANTDAQIGTSRRS